MHARVVEILFQPQHVQTVIDRFRATSIEVIATLPGARGFIGSLNRESGRTYTISFWDRAEQRDASASDPTIMENLAGYAVWMAGPFSRDSLDVPRHTFVPVDPADPFSPEFVAAASGMADPSRWDEALTRLCDQAGAPDVPGFRGAAILTNPTSGRIIRVQLWDTLAAAEAAREQLAVADLQLRRDGYLLGSPIYDTHEVAGRWSAPASASR